MAAVARSGSKMFLVVESRRDRGAAAAHAIRTDVAMIPRSLFVALITLVAAGVTCAQPAPPAQMPSPLPAVTLSASATASVPNDRMLAWLRAGV